MSVPRNCDRCGTNFALKEKDSAKFAGIIYREYDTGEAYEQHKDLDFCPACTKLMEKPKVGQADYARIRELEAANGLPPSEPTMP